MAGIVTIIFILFILITPIMAGILAIRRNDGTYLGVPDSDADIRQHIKQYKRKYHENNYYQ